MEPYKIIIEGSLHESTEITVEHDNAEQEAAWKSVLQKVVDDLRASKHDVAKVTLIHGALRGGSRSWPWLEPEKESITSSDVGVLSASEIAG